VQPQRRVHATLGNVGSYARHAPRITG